MTIINVLVELDKLLSSWNISESDWILVSQYAYKLLGFDVKIRKSHLNILVRKNAIPWNIKEGLEVHPPRGTKYRQDFQKFMDKTGFDFDLNLSGDSDFKNKEGKYVQYTLPNSKKVRIQKPIGAIKEFEKLLANSTNSGFGVERLNKDIYYIRDMIRVLAKKGDKETEILFKNLLTKFLQAKRVRHVIVNRNKNVIRGIVAAKGYAEGKAFVVKDSKELSDKIKGEILVTPMTSPELFRFITKVKAIVTDQGGRLSHAAILAREFNIPCVVGTQVATEILKTGDIVEVDADSGMVRKLPKNQK